MSDQPRLLCVFAHPDDESYGPGGAIAHYALRGVSISLCIFTCGEAGSIGVSKEIPNDELCRLRTAELADACEALGIEEHRILGVPDGGVGDADHSWSVRQIIDDIERFRPQVMITFHHHGISGHSDHIAVAEYAAEAFDKAAESPGGPQKLYEYGIPPGRARLYQRKNLVPLDEDELNARIEISDEAMERKLEAIRRHRTQYDFFLSLSEKFDYRTMARPEYFFLRKTRLHKPSKLETDLFAGTT
jgi:N-acetyl-1-D-myo-inositol-2-amino-2-deoxy-alpha-D-glucopyranoside deacetylase